MLREFWGYFGRYKKYFIISVVCVILEGVFELIIPLLMANIIDVGVKNHDTGYILQRGALMVACALISLALGAAYARFAALAGQGFGAELRRAEYEKVQAYSFSNIDRFHTSSLVTRLTNDVTVLQNAICNGIRPLVRGPVMLLMALTMSVLLSARLALVFAVAIPLLAAGLFCILRSLRPAFGRMQRALDRVNSVVQENLMAIRVVKSFVRGDHESEKFREVNGEFQESSTRAFHFAALNTPCFQLVMYATIVAILWFGGGMIMAGTLQVGKLTGFLSYVMQILNSLMMISNVFMMLTRSMTSAARIREVLEEEPDIRSVEENGARVLRGEIAFEHVYFKYAASAEEYVLSDITLRIQAGQTVGILGGTGSAKTSLVQLIPRLYDVSAGRLTIDGRDVREYPLRHLRDAVGMVLQKNTLFSGTIRENLLWGNEAAGQEELDWACHIACADEFIRALPDGYETRLGQGGAGVSGGQKQRLCIARALLKHPRVLIFDDSTSAVDTATEALIRERMQAELRDTTKILIAQRISSIEEADQIVVLDEGRIQDVGTHSELLARSAIYAEVCATQKKGAMV